MTRSARAPRQVVIVAYPDVQSLDVTGPLEVFAGAGRLVRAGSSGGRGYEIAIVSRDGAPLRSSSGLTLVPDAAVGAAPRDIDTLIVAGGAGCERAAEDVALVEWIARSAAAARRTAAVCTGAFLLARAGVLEGRRATTHWSAAEQLARRYPGVDVDADPIFLRDGNVWTSAGVTAGMDLALALEEGADSIASVAAACGFGTPETMRRVFLRTLDVGPAEYRRRFQARPAHTRRAA